MLFEINKRRLSNNEICESMYNERCPFPVYVCFIPTVTDKMDFYGEISPLPKPRSECALFYLRISMISPKSSIITWIHLSEDSENNTIWVPTQEKRRAKDLFYLFEIDWVMHKHVSVLIGIYCLLRLSFCCPCHSACLEGELLNKNSTNIWTGKINERIPFRTLLLLFVALCEKSICQINTKCGGVRRANGCKREERKIQNRKNLLREQNIFGICKSVS